MPTRPVADPSVRVVEAIEEAESVQAYAYDDGFEMELVESQTKVAEQAAALAVQHGSSAAQSGADDDRDAEDNDADEFADVFDR